MADIDIAVEVVPSTIDIAVEMVGGGGGVSSVNGQTGAVVLDAEDVGADPAGSASAALGTAQGYTDTAVSGLVESSDPRLSDARTPTAHAATHAAGGSDPITPTSIGAEPTLPSQAGNSGKYLMTDGSSPSWETPSGGGGSGDGTSSLYAASVSGSTSIDVANGAVQELTLAGDTTFSLATPSATSKAVTLTVSVIQDGTGGWAITWPSVKWSQGFAPSFPTMANAESVVTFLWSNSRGWRGFVSGVWMATP